MSESCNLAWQGPFHLPEDLKGAPRLPRATGVYMWTRNSRVGYVGYTSDIWERQYQHVFYLLGGAYWIEDSEGKRSWKPGRLVTGHSDEDYAGSVERMGWILSNPAEAIREVRAYLERTDVFFAEAERDTARTAEWMLQAHLGLDRRGSQRKAQIHELVNKAPDDWRGDDLSVFGTTLVMGPNDSVRPL